MEANTTGSETRVWTDLGELGAKPTAVYDHVS